MEKDVLHVDEKNYLALAHSADTKGASEHMNMDILGRVRPDGTMLSEIVLHHMFVMIVRGSVIVDVRRRLEPWVTEVEVDGGDVDTEDFVDRERVLADGGVVNVSGSDGEVVIVWKGVKHVETSALERVEVLLEIMIQRLELRVLSEEVLLPGAICNARDV